MNTIIISVCWICLVDWIYLNYSIMHVPSQRHTSWLFFYIYSVIWGKTRALYIYGPCCREIWRFVYPKKSNFKGRYGVCIFVHLLSWSGDYITSMTNKYVWRYTLFCRTLKSYLSINNCCWAGYMIFISPEHAV
jgi:hypothetical protein